MDIVQRRLLKGLEVNFANGIVYALNPTKAHTARSYTYVYILSIEIHINVYVCVYIYIIFSTVSKRKKNEKCAVAMEISEGLVYTKRTDQRIRKTCKGCKGKDNCAPMTAWTILYTYRIRYMCVRSTGKLFSEC